MDSLSIATNAIHQQRMISQTALGQVLNVLDDRIKVLEKEFAKIKKEPPPIKGKKQVLVKATAEELEKLKNERSKLGSLFSKGLKIKKDSKDISWIKNVDHQLRVTADRLVDPKIKTLSKHVKEIRTHIGELEKESTKSSMKMMNAVATVQGFATKMTSINLQEGLPFSSKYATYKEFEKKTAALSRLLHAPPDSHDAQKNLLEKAPELVQAMLDLTKASDAFNADAEQLRDVYNSFEKSTAQTKHQVEKLQKQLEEHAELPSATRQEINKNLSHLVDGYLQEFAIVSKKYAGKKHDAATVAKMNTEINHLIKKMQVDISNQETIVHTLLSTSKDLTVLKENFSDYPAIPEHCNKLLVNFEQVCARIHSKYAGKTDPANVQKMKQEVNAAAAQLRKDVVGVGKFVEQLDGHRNIMQGVIKDLNDQNFILLKSPVPIIESAQFITLAEQEFVKIHSKYAGKTDPKEIASRDRELANVGSKLQTDLMVARSFAQNLTTLNDAMIKMQDQMQEELVPQKVQNEVSAELSTILAQAQPKLLQVIQKYKGKTSPADIAKMKQEVNKINRDVREAFEHKYSTLNATRVIKQAEDEFIAFKAQMANDPLLLDASLSASKKKEIQQSFDAIMADAEHELRDLKKEYSKQKPSLKAAADIQGGIRAAMSRLSNRYSQLGNFYQASHIVDKFERELSTYKANIEKDRKALESRRMPKERVEQIIGSYSAILADAEHSIRDIKEEFAGQPINAENIEKMQEEIMRARDLLQNRHRDLNVFFKMHETLR